MADQATRLRELAQRYRSGAQVGAPRPRARVLAITSGKGGVGKTNLAVNLSYGLIALGKEVILLDADLSLANTDILVGTRPPADLGSFVRGERTLGDLVFSAPGNLLMVAGGSGLVELTNLSAGQLEALVTALGRLEAMADFLVLDTAAGLGEAVLRFVLAADQVLVVATLEPTAMADAYAVTKAVLRRMPEADIKLVLNQVRRLDEARVAAEQFAAVVYRFLAARVDFLGSIPWDPVVSAAVRDQSPFFLGRPDSPPSREVGRIARRLTGAPAAAAPQTGYVDRLRVLLRDWRGG